MYIEQFFLQVSHGSVDHGIWGRMLLRGCSAFHASNFVYLMRLSLVLSFPYLRLDALVFLLTPIITAMAVIRTREGTIPFKIVSIDYPCVTYHKIIGDFTIRSPAVAVSLR